MKRLLFVTLVGFTIIGCSKYPTDTVSSEETDVIISLYDQDANFSNYQTFAIVDSVLQLDFETGAIDPDSSTSRYSDRMINDVSNYLIGRGYTKVHRDSSPDLGIDMVVINAENLVAYTYWPGYWGWYGWYYWYPWPSTSVYQYNKGTLNVTMFDIKNRDTTQNRVDVLWDNLANGVLSNTASANSSRVDRAIDIMFQQSPYVKR